MYLASRKPTLQPKGYIALMSVVVISLVLLVVAVSVSAGGFYGRFNVLDNELKRISLGAAESCVNLGLLKAGQNYNYVQPAGGIHATVGEAECVADVVLSAEVNNEKTVNITARGNYRGTWSTVHVEATVQSPTIAPATETADITVQMIMNGGTLQHNAFAFTVNGVEYTGAAVTYVRVPAGTYSVQVEPVAGYETHYSGDCGPNVTVEAGDSEKKCIITNTAQATDGRITLLVNVINDNDGDMTAGQAQLSIVSTLMTYPATMGQAVTLPPGEYTARSILPSQYQSKYASIWGRDCDSNGNLLNPLLAGESKTCVITYDDIPPPSPSCADTVMMLDRTGSIFDIAGAPSNEALAAMGLLDQYKTVTPVPLVGVGSFPGVDLTNNVNFDASVPVSGQLRPADDPGEKPNSNAILARPASAPIFPVTINANQQQVFSGFDFNFPPTTFKGIEVNFTGQVIESGVTSSPVGVEVSWNGGANWTTTNISRPLSSTSSQQVAGGSTYLWPNRTWTNTQLANFRVRLENKSLTNNTIRITALSTRVYYMDPGTKLYGTINQMMTTSTTAPTNLHSAIVAGHNELLARHRPNAVLALILVSDGVANLPSGSAQSAATQAANSAKADGVKIYTLHYGNVNGRSFLASLSSGDGYSFIAPNSSQLPTVFSEIAKKACPALAPTPTTPTTGMVTTFVSMDNTGGGGLQPSDFALTVTGTTPSRTTFPGNALGTQVTFGAGSYTINPGSPGSYIASADAGCHGTITGGAQLTCVVSYVYVPITAPPPPPPPLTVGEMTINRWYQGL